MKSRAELLAEIEEKRRQNKQLDHRASDLQIAEPEMASGYNPYDNPGTHKGTDVDDLTRRRTTPLRRR